MSYPEYERDMETFKALDAYDKTHGTVGQMKTLLRLVRYLLSQLTP